MRTINFFHLERGGGRTMKDLLARQYNNIFDIYQSKDFDGRLIDLYNMNVANRYDIELIQGHQYFGIHKALEQPVTYIAIFRHPVNKVISAYQSYRRTVDSPNHEWAMENTLKQALKKKLKVHFDNGYTRVLVFENSNEEVPYGKVTEEHFLLAKGRLEKHFLVGTTDKYDEFLVLLYHTLDWKYPFYTKANFAKPEHKLKYPFFDVETLELIIEQNEYDLRLYHWIEGRVATYSPFVLEFERKVKRFKFLNKTVGKLFIRERLSRLLKRRFG